MAEKAPEGIYSTTRTTYVGTGMTRRKNVVKRYWKVSDVGEDQFLVQPLNQNMAPAGKQKLINRREFEERYEYEPDFYAAGEQGVIRHVWRQPDQPDTESPDSPAAAESSPDKGAPPEAAQAAEPGKGSGKGPGKASSPFVLEDDEPYEEKPAAKSIDEVEREARADFGLGITYLKRGNPEMATRIFEDLAGVKGDFDIRHKHMFNEFGIGLRKNKLHRVAHKHYERALELSPNDDHLYHNIARLFYESGNVTKAVEFLEKSLELNPELQVSKLFLEFIRKKQGRKEKKSYKFQI